MVGQLTSRTNKSNKQYLHAKPARTANLNRLAKLLLGTATFFVGDVRAFKGIDPSLKTAGSKRVLNISADQILISGSRELKISTNSKQAGHDAVIKDFSSSSPIAEASVGRVDTLSRKTTTRFANHVGPAFIGRYIYDNSEQTKGVFLGGLNVVEDSFSAPNAVTKYTARGIAESVSESWKASVDKAGSGTKIILDKVTNDERLSQNSDSLPGSSLGTKNQLRDNENEMTFAEFVEQWEPMLDRLEHVSSTLDNIEPLVNNLISTLARKKAAGASPERKKDVLNAKVSIAEIQRVVSGLLERIKDVLGSTSNQNETATANMLESIPELISEYGMFTLETITKQVNLVKPKAQMILNVLKFTQALMEPEIFEEAQTLAKKAIQLISYVASDPSLKDTPKNQLLVKLLNTLKSTDEMLDSLEELRPYFKALNLSWIFLQFAIVYRTTIEVINLLGQPEVNGRLLALKQRLVDQNNLIQPLMRRLL